MTAYIWSCLAATLPPALAVDCTEGGEYAHNAAGGDSGAAWQHTRDSGHPTVTHVAEWAALVEPERAA